MNLGQKYTGLETSDICDGIAMKISWKMITDEGVEIHSTHQDYAKIKAQIRTTKSRSMTLEVDGGGSHNVDIIGYTENCIAQNYSILKIKILNDFSFRGIKAQAMLCLA